MRNLFGLADECELFVHWSTSSETPPLEAALSDERALAGGYRPLWRTTVWYEADASPQALNLTVGPFEAEVLSGEVVPYLHALLVRTEMLKEFADNITGIPSHHVINQSL